MRAAQHRAENAPKKGTDSVGDNLSEVFMMQYANRLASIDEREHWSRKYSDISEKVVPHLGETNVCPDVDDDICEEQVKSVTDGGVEVNRGQECDK